MTTLDDLQADPNYKNPANGRALPRHAANPHTNVDIIHGGGGGGGGGGGSSIDYTVLITAIKNSVTSIDSDTDALAGILTAVDTLESIGTTGNATTSQILTAVSSILTQAQATSANTDQLEELLTSQQTTLQTESDQTQVGLSEIKAAIDAIPLDAEYLQLVDYVEGGQVIGTAGVTVLTLQDLTPVSISGTAPPFTPSASYGATDGATSWKLVGQLQTVAGQRYNINSSIIIGQSTIKYIAGSQVIEMVQAVYDDVQFVGDGTLIEVGYIFEPNTDAGTINQFTVSTLASIAPKSCTDFLRKIVGGVASDYKLDGVTSYALAGVALSSCPFTRDPAAVFKHGVVENFGTKQFTGYKSLSIYVLSGTVSIYDGTETVNYPIIGDNGTVAGVDYLFHEGVVINNTIGVACNSADAKFLWNGVV